ncbi:MAG: 3-carboxymuconate cyclase [Candidatus Sulfotelmatobacter sp.]|nr:3-carboxymuconate cyclase [Candidatus Sulfotelmatobacter sp.]
MKNTYAARLQVLAFVIIIVTASATNIRAQTYTDLYNLGSNSGDPLDPAWVGLFAQGRDGNLYSTTTDGGVNTVGTVFRLSPSGTMTPWSFDSTGTDAFYPYSGLTLGTDGNFYGTSYAGGSAGAGTVFKVTPSGIITTLHSFNGCSEGSNVYAPPIEGLDGNFYGVASDGGCEVFGTVYKITPSGTLTVIYTFPGTSGLSYPQAIALGTDGNFYGTTLGATGGYGGVFKITPQGKLTVLHTFTDFGQGPKGMMIQANDGNFYGTTSHGGVNGVGAIYKMTPAGTLTVIYSFDTAGLGDEPYAGLIQATDGKFYGAASGYPFGHLFQITSTGTYTHLVSFTNVAGLFPGSTPQVALFQNTNGTLYGDTYGGGAGLAGVLYSLGMNLGPFVRFVGPLFEGKVGKNIEILGQGFTGTSKVSFHGAAATFKVVSDTYLTAVVPAAAITGSVIVTTPGRTLTSNKIFRVTPAILSFNPSSGSVGTPVTITGTSFTGATVVTFGGVKATTFSVDSNTQITATVPAGAKTGKIQVTTPGGTAISATTFTVS